MARIGCQMGIVAPVASLKMIVIGVAGGKKVIHVAMLPLGERTMKIQINIGSIITIQTGRSIDCASFSCETDAPTVMKIAEKNSTPKI